MCSSQDCRGDAESFSREIATCIPALRRGARLLTRNDDAAADLTQETLAKAWAARFTFTPGTNLKGWLFTIMRNQFRSEMRRAWRRVPWDDERGVRIPAARDEQNWSVELKDAARAIAALSRRQREAVILAGVGGFSTEEVAAISSCRITAVKSRVSRARHTMRSMLDGTAPLRTGRSDTSGNSIDDLTRQLQQLAAKVSSEGVSTARQTP